MAGYVVRRSDPNTFVSLHYYKVGYAGGPNEGRRLVEDPPSVGFSRENAVEVATEIFSALGVPIEAVNELLAQAGVAREEMVPF